MLYTLCVLITGIYLGQEYDIIPPVKFLAIQVLYLFKNEIDNDEENVDRMNGLFSIVRRFFNN